jgi:hypothetical protein
MRAKPDTVTENVANLRQLADRMNAQGCEWAIEVHALAVDLAEALGRSVARD